MSTKIQITDARMLQLMEYCTANKMNGISTIKSWCEAIAISHTNIFNIRNGIQQFTISHIRQACEVFSARPDFIFGYTDEMFRADAKRSPLERIKEAVAELEFQEKKNKPVAFLKKSKSTKPAPALKSGRSKAS